MIGGCGLLAACGSAASPTTGGAAATKPAPKATLMVVERQPGGHARHWTLQCDPPGGTAPNATAACQQLRAETGVLHPARFTHIMCPMIIANARTFTITGTWYGTRVHETVIDGGCDLTRWAKMAQIFN